MAGFIKNLFKKSDYYLDLGEGKTSTTTEAAKTEAPVAAKTEAPVAPEAPTETAPKASKKTSIKSKTDAVAAAPKAPEPVKAPAVVSPPAPATFAATSVISNTTPRRRPGANMASFLDMARQFQK